MTEKEFRIKKVKINGVKTTVSVPPSHELWPYWYERFFSWLSIQWLLKTSGIRLWWMYKKDAIARRKYCNKGYHKIKNYHTYSKIGNQKAVSFHFIKCVHCNYMFFPTKNLKEKYLKHEKETKERFSAVFNSLSGNKTGLSFSAGKEEKADSSVRPSRANKKRGKDGRT